MRFLVTGASGYIGTRLTILALQDGHNITFASRRKSEKLSSSCLFFDLSDSQAIAIPNQIQIVIHLAANTTNLNSTEAEEEIKSAENLLNSSKKIGAKFIFVSSQTAAPNAPTIYGKTKWSIEEKVLLSGGSVVRPGLVYGGELRGLFGILTTYIKKLPILPAFIPSPRVQPIHIDDFVNGLLRIATRVDIQSKVYQLASPNPILFSTFLKAIAESRVRRTRFFFPTPILFLKLIEITLGGLIKSQSWHYRLRSLFSLCPMDTLSDLNQLNLKLRPLHSGLHPSGMIYRRYLMREGIALLEYILKKPPSSTTLRRYVRAMERLRNGYSLGLPKLLLNHPSLLSAMNRFMWAEKVKYAEYIWRLDSATIIAEATPLGAHRFLNYHNRKSMSATFLAIIVAGSLGIFWLLIGLIAIPYFRHILNINKVPYGS